MRGIHTQIVIPVHDETRPIRRAAESVLADPLSGVIVIAHNIDPEILDIPEHDRLEVVPLEGAKGMPGATFDAGIAAATAPWVGIMGSDDWYDAGALEAMRERQKADGSDGVIAPLRHQLTDINTLKPLTWRTSKLDAVRDRLFYRTAPLGIYRTEMMQDPHLRFGAVFPAGSDQRVSALMWTSGRNFSYYWNDPAYVVGKDAKTRVTFTPRPLAQTGAPYDNLLEEPGVLAFTERQKHALAVKMARVHVIDLARLRPNLSDWREGDFNWLSRYVKKLRNFDPTFDRPLSRRDAAVVSAAEAGDLPRMLKAVESYGEAGIVSRVLTSSLTGTFFEHDAPLRNAFTGIAARERGRIRAIRG
ncbi:glycosyltransferase family 2 protein [Trueperella bialowiezensis]|uniref:glycosyltransferase family 2 protein n=1 Tax=Trueperella bialowiezensis TaxID=312285 RepID=UPI0013E02D59|nr:glycosyltransferase [Trueperella bialowiezensis]